MLGSENLRSAIKSPVMSMGEEKIEEKVMRRVNFPADDSLVTGYLEPPNPWAKALDVTSEDLVQVYKSACEALNIKPINKVIQQLQQIESISNRVDCLSLKGEKLDHRHYEALEEIFKRVQFETIDVEATNLDEETSVALFDMIEYYESARNLNIALNRNLNLRSWQACARMLKKTPTLESLDARSTPLNEHIMQLLCRTLRAGSNLTTLHLENCNISGRSCTVLMNALKVNSTLSELYLADNKLNSTDALQIGNLLRSNSRLKHLDLRCNHVLDSGIAHIVDGLNDQSIGPGEGLETLILWSNQLTFCSTAHLAKVVVKCSSLLTLNIGNNNITNEGVFHLKEALMKNRTLMNIGLQQAKLTCEGAVAVAEYIAENPSIQLIDLRENNIKIAGLLALSLSMRVNKSVTRLDLDKDPKKETNKDLQDQHQKLLLEIMECCERNNQELVKQKAEHDSENALDEGEQTEILSESVSRLLSLFEQTPKIKTSLKQTKKHHGQPLSPTPVIVLPEHDTPVSLVLTPSSSPNLSPINPGLLSPPAICPSPPKSRFRVSRVSADTDSFVSSAGSTPMPSPVPSPGHTPFASPGCSPFPSPLSSPMGSPLSSPFRNGFGVGTSFSSYLSTSAPIKMPTSKPSLLVDPLKKRALKTWNSSSSLPRSDGCCLRPFTVTDHPGKTVRTLFSEVLPSGISAPPPSPVVSDSGTVVYEVPPNTPDERSDDMTSWSEDDTGDLSELRISCGSESWMDSLSDGLLSGGSSPTSESCPSLSSYSNVTPLTSPTPNPSISTVEEYKDPSEVTVSGTPSSEIVSEKWPTSPAPILVSPMSEMTTESELCSAVSLDSGVATPDSELSSASSSVSYPSSMTSLEKPFLGTLAPPCSPIGVCATSLNSSSATTSDSPQGTNKRALSPKTSQNGFEDGAVQTNMSSGAFCLELPETGELELLSPASFSIPIRKKKKTEDDDKMQCGSSATTPTKMRDIKLAEPSCVLLFGGGLPSGNVFPRQIKDLTCFEASNEVAKSDLEFNVYEKMNTEMLIQKRDKENRENMEMLLREQDDEEKGKMEILAQEREEEEKCDMERRRQIEELKRSLEEAKVLIGRRASTGSFPGTAGSASTSSKQHGCRRTSTMVDELIQKQLMELHKNVYNNEEEDQKQEVQKTDDIVEGIKDTMEESDENGNACDTTVLRLSVQITDDADDKFPLVDEEHPTVCHLETQVPEETLAQVAMKYDDESNQRLTATVAFIHSDMSPVRQRLIGSGTLDLSSDSSTHIRVNPQCRSIGPGDLFQLIEDLNDSLPSIDASGKVY
uniref:Uncharacterized protein n=1 Tax=Strigamia maritima TaxID=126957 RepID=T1J462_STRMM